MPKDWTQQDKERLLGVREALGRVIKAGLGDLRLKRFRRRASLEVSGLFYTAPRGKPVEPTGFMVTLQSGHEKVQVDLWDLLALAVEE